MLTQAASRCSTSDFARSLAVSWSGAVVRIKSIDVGIGGKYTIVDVEAKCLAEGVACSTQEAGVSFLR
jgi:hypothetical protein